MPSLVTCCAGTEHLDCRLSCLVMAGDLRIDPASSFQFVINAAAGCSDADKKRGFIEAVLQAEGRRSDLHFCTPPELQRVANDVAQPALSTHTAVVAFGGDSTLNSVPQAAHAAGCAMGRSGGQGRLVPGAGARTQFGEPAALGQGLRAGMLLGRTVGLLGRQEGLCARQGQRGSADQAVEGEARSTTGLRGAATTHSAQGGTRSPGRAQPELPFVPEEFGFFYVQGEKALLLPDQYRMHIPACHHSACYQP